MENPEPQRTALLLGNGNYAQYLCDNLHKKGIATHLIALFRKGEWSITATPDYQLDLSQVGALFQYLREKNIQSAFVGGDFTLAQAMTRGRWSWHLDPVSVELAAKLLDVPELLKNVRSHLDAAGVRLLFAPEYLPELRLSNDIIHDSNILTRASKLTGLVEKARAILAKGSMPFVTQCVAFDDDELIAKEGPRGTDRMLKKLAGTPKKADALRVVIKLCPRDYEYRIDAPLIGDRTMTHAATGKVDVFIFDEKKGVVFRPDEVASICRAHRIALMRAGSL